MELNTLIINSQSGIIQSIKNPLAPHMPDRRGDCDFTILIIEKMLVCTSDSLILSSTKLLIYFEIIIIQLRNLNNLPFAAFVGADAVEYTFGFEDGEVSLHTFWRNADFFRECAGGVLRIFAEQFDYSIAGLDLFLWLLNRSIFSD